MLAVEHQLRDLSACDDFHYDFLDYKYADESSFFSLFVRFNRKQIKKENRERGEEENNEEGMRKWNFVRDLHFHFAWLLHYNNMLS